MKRMLEIQNRKAAIVKAMRALTDGAEADGRLSLSDTETEELSSLEAKLKEVTNAEATEKKLQDIERSLQVVPDVNASTPQELADLAGKPHPKVSFPANFSRSRSGSLQSFKGEKAEERAYLSGMWFRATMFGDDRASLWCQNNGIKLLATSTSQNSDVNTAGGYLVPDELSQAIIDLRETYGVFRRNVRPKPMGSDTMLIPRRSGGLTAYFVSQQTDTTASQKTWDMVQLTAKELAAMVRYSSNLDEDAVISLADDLASEIAYSFALKEDQCGFIGDGTSTYGGIHGVATKINDGNHAASIADAASGNTAFSTLDLADFHLAVGKLPLYARPMAKWYISAAGYANSMERLMYAGGGNTVSTIGGGSGPSFLGYPVEVSQVLNSTLGADVSAIKCLFGDLSMAATMGDRRGFTLESSRERYFEFRQIAIQGTERFDINAHDLGDGTNAGPIVAVKTPGS